MFKELLSIAGLLLLSVCGLSAFVSPQVGAAAFALFSVLVFIAALAILIVGLIRAVGRVCGG